MQNIRIQLEDEKGQSIENSEVNFADVVGHLWESNQINSYPWISGIDPYENTLFNKSQVPHVIKELELVKEQATDEDVVKAIVETIELMKKVSDHTYMKFIGD